MSFSLPIWFRFCNRPHRGSEKSRKNGSVRRRTTQMKRRLVVPVQLLSGIHGGHGVVDGAERLTRRRRAHADFGVLGAPMGLLFDSAILCRIRCMLYNALSAFMKERRQIGDAFRNGFRIIYKSSLDAERPRQRRVVEKRVQECVRLARFDRWNTE